MLVSTRGRYALRVMIDLARGPAEDYVPLKEIARRQEISEKYLESILKLLVRGRLLTGQRGKGGGYRLNRPPADYTVFGILRLTESGLSPVACLEEAAPCPRQAQCPTLSMWQGLDRVIRTYLEGVTLADLAGAGPAALCGEGP